MNQRRAPIFRKAQNESAQGVIEFALISMILMFLFLGTVDFARFMYYDTAIRTAARIGDEAAINHCAATYYCAAPQATTYDLVLQKTYCEPRPYVNFTLQSSISCDSVTASQPSPCPVSGGSASCPPACPSSGQDICISPSYAPLSKTQVPGNTDATVWVGYNFRPISFLMAPFFKSLKCWTTAGGAPNDDGNQHTLCASSTGRISS